MAAELDDECLTCTEPGSGIEGECPMSQRPCGHHCNHVWDQDICHWCLAEVNEDGDLIPNYAPVEPVPAVAGSLREEPNDG